MYKNKCDNCVKSNICMVNFKLREAKQELKLESYKTNTKILDGTYIDKSEIYFFDDVNLGVRECKHYIEKNVQYLDEKNKKEIEQEELEKDIALAMFNSLKLYPSHDGLNLSMRIDDYDKKEENLERLNKICNYLIPFFGYAKVDIRTYEYGQKITDMNFIFKKHGFGISVYYYCSKDLVYTEGILIAKQYANSISNDFDNYKD